MELKNIRSSYRKELIYDDLNLVLDEVGMTFVKGNSGAGKSTLLNILYGIKSFKGEYDIPEPITKFRRNNMSYIFQDYKIQPNLTVLENIELHLQIKDIEIDYNYIDELLDTCYMKHNKYKKAKLLSGGEKQRLAIVRALVTNPSVLLCDEPTGNLDEDTSFEIFDILKEISKTKLVVVASHSVVLIEKYADRIYQVENHNLTPLKFEEKDKLKYTNVQYGAISRKDVNKLAWSNFKKNYIKITAIFTVFAIFSALFLVLNFSKNSFDDSLNEKYESYPGKNGFVVNVFGYSSFAELDALVERFGYDGYMLDGIYNPRYTTGVNKGLASADKSYKGYKIFRLYNTDLLSDKKIVDENTIGYESHYKEKYTEDEMKFSYVESVQGTMFVVNDYSYISRFVIHGRIPKGGYEVLVNINTIKSIIEDYNEKMLAVDESFTKLIFEDMSSDEIMKFINDNKLSIGYDEDKITKDYDRIKLLEYNFEVVGVVDDNDFRFDNYPYNLDQRHSNTFRRHNRNLYVHKDYFTSQLQLATNNYINFWAFRDYILKPSDYVVDPARMLENPRNVYTKEMFKTILVIDEDLDTVTYLERINAFSEDKWADSIKFPEFYYEISEDLNNQENINNYINNYSFYILTIGIITALVAFIRFSIRRKEEYLIYELLGMEGKEKRKLYGRELVLISLNYLLLVVAFYFVFTIFMSDVIENTITGLIYKTSDFSIAYTFGFGPVLILAALLLPFTLCYVIFRRKLVR